jgi:hypothetical protein
MWPAMSDIDAAAVRRGHRSLLLCGGAVIAGLIADAAMLTRACPVRHLMPDGRLSEQRVAAGARVRADGLLVRGGG